MATITLNGTRIQDVMTPNPIFVHADATPRQVARLFVEHNISGVPVVDHQRRVIGVVSKTDLLNWCVRGGLGFGAPDPLQQLADNGIGTRVQIADLGIVTDFMTNHPLTAGPNDLLSDAAVRMGEHGVHRLIVVDEQDQLLGVITSLDVMRALSRG